MHYKAINILQLFEIKVVFPFFFKYDVRWLK
jgi:hypothetical protein